MSSILKKAGREREHSPDWGMRACIWTYNADTPDASFEADIVVYGKEVTSSRVKYGY